MNHTPNCPVDIDMRGQWMSTAKPLCNCGGNAIADSNPDNFKFLGNPAKFGSLTPLGEALQTPCPRCDKPWIQHYCPTQNTLNAPTVAESGCEHEFKFSHQSVEARGVQAIYQTVIYVICPKCGLVKTQI